MNGKQVASKIREIVEYEKVPIICCSANEPDKKDWKYFTKIMNKPISSEDVDELTKMIPDKKHDHSEILKSPMNNTFPIRHQNADSRGMLSNLVLRIPELSKQTVTQKSLGGDDATIQSDLKDDMGIRNMYKEEYVRPNPMNYVNPNYFKDFDNKLG